MLNPFYAAEPHYLCELLSHTRWRGPLTAVYANWANNQNSRPCCPIRFLSMDTARVCSRRVGWRSD